MQALKAPKKQENQKREFSLGGAGLLRLCLWVSTWCFVFLLIFFLFRNFGHGKQRQSIKFVLHLARSEGCGRGSPVSSRSVTGQLSPSSEVVDEHGHTVRAHQVVWVSGEGFVLPSFGITCRRIKHKTLGGRQSSSCVPRIQRRSNHSVKTKHCGHLHLISTRDGSNSVANSNCT